MYGFSRKYENQEVLVLINRGATTATITLPILKKGKYKDVFTQKRVKKLSVSPMDIVVLTGI